ncbi:MAG: hypothetical protein C4B59_10675 [Candidatus Methanogaster sp.]|uniref:Uncharacterized protein n=1 Tax=Candidatus Methanogaster sp. TaxID=3386292 RepID=A0AC61L0T6_9EURY|nr:MAG: hypothetical protein C4B59_10675 [ANME-2 cluster archaeon]
MVSVAVYAEGPTEWLVARKLWKRKILNGMGFLGAEERQPGDLIVGGGVDTFLKNLFSIDRASSERGVLIRDRTPFDRVLLMFDQEQMPNLEKYVKSKIETHLREIGIVSNFDKADDEIPNVFTGNIQTLPVAIHVANHDGMTYKKGPDLDGNRDFDGYIVELLQNLEDDPIGVSIVQRMLKETHQEKVKVMHQIGNQKIPDLMKDDQLPIKRSKTILYSHITAMQIGKSHVHFSEKVVEESDEDNLRTVFKSLIAAWDSLKREDDV